MARRSSRFIRPAPRTKMWIGAGVGTTSIASAVKALISTLSAGALLLRSFTILRTRMDILIASDQEGVDETPHGSFGQIVVTETAAGLGITALPNPSGISGDPEASWFVWQAMSVQFRFASGVGFDANAGMHYTIDSKSMRKVGPDDDIATLFDNETASGLTITTNGRRLIQLH